jgi:DNA polymerase
MAWCEWRLDVFATHGKIYEASAEQMFGLPAGSVTKKSPYRQKGKISELALGYQGGAGALKTMGALEMGLTEDELEPIKVAWRAANPEIVNLWYACERAAKQAVASKAMVPLTIAGGRTRLVFAYESGFLTITLPSKRKLFYVKPRIETEDLYRETTAGGRYVLASTGSLTYEGMDQKTKQWTRLPTYGGKLVENITQAVARDCLAEAMLALDAEGYPQLFTVHDEDIVELPYSSPKGLKDVEAVMGRPIAWAKDLPLRGDGFETEYYMKEID